MDLWSNVLTSLLSDIVLIIYIVLICGMIQWWSLYDTCADLLCVISLVILTCFLGRSMTQNLCWSADWFILLCSLLLCWFFAHVLVRSCAVLDVSWCRLSVDILCCMILLLSCVHSVVLICCLSLCWFSALFDDFLLISCQILGWFIVWSCAICAHISCWYLVISCTDLCCNFGFVLILGVTLCWSVIWSCFAMWYDFVLIFGVFLCWSVVWVLVRGY